MKLFISALFFSFMVSGLFAQDQEYTKDSVFNLLQQKAMEWITTNSAKYELNNLVIDKEFTQTDSIQTGDSLLTQICLFKLSASNYHSEKENGDSIVSLEFYFYDDSRLNSIVLLKGDELIVIENPE